MHLLIPDEKIDAVAARMGVQADVLIEARAQFKIRRARYGLQMPLGQKVAKTRHFQLQCEMPEEVYAAWQEECHSRGIEGSVLLRSVVHAYLLGTNEPVKVLKRWIWNGKTIRATAWEKRRRIARSRERAQITVGAKRALELRAQRHGSPRSALVRALVLDVIDRRWQGVQLVDAEMMYDDETRYVTPSLTPQRSAG